MIPSRHPPAGVAALTGSMELDNSVLWLRRGVTSVTCVHGTILCASITVMKMKESMGRQGACPACVRLAGW